jgi:hypothetical protein
VFLILIFVKYKQSFVVHIEGGVWVGGYIYIYIYIYIYRESERERERGGDVCSQLFTKYYSGDKIERNEIRMACSTYGR